MIFYKERKRLITYLTYLKIIVCTWFVKAQNKVVFVDISKIEINRYLYSLLKMFALEGFTVIIPKDIRTIKILSNSKGEFRYASWLLKDGVIKFGKPKELKNDQRIISANQLSNNYFGINQSDNVYHVPMCCYPIYYRKFHLLKGIDLNSKRKNSLFMSGNMDLDYYKSMDSSDFFNLPSRSKVSEYLKSQFYYMPINDQLELNNFILNTIDNKVILINTKQDFRISYPELLKILSSFRFYLALPGIIIPQSHNLIEAMACGCIPVINAEYASLMKPPLENGYNAFLFNGLEDLHLQIQNIFNESEELYIQMENNVNLYYNTYLTPSAVVDSIMNKKLDTIYIQAEHLSLKLLD